MNELSEFFSIWNVTRAAAITAYLLLFISMVTGITFNLPIVPKRYQTITRSTHETTGWFALLFGMVHGLVLLLEKEYTSYTLLNILVPFTVKHDALALSLGIFSFYGMLLLIVSTDFLKKIGKKLWRLIHFVSFPAFFSALLHGILIGSDSKNSVMVFMYVFTGCTVTLLTIFRVIYEYQSRKKKVVVESNHQ
ncbi:MAG: ferric reductase-like transmembrane domain-containing protein [Bacillus sp. (in: firmicutes)]